VCQLKNTAILRQQSTPTQIPLDIVDPRSKRKMNGGVCVLFWRLQTEVPTRNFCSRPNIYINEGIHVI
jgi:hypothetical protein